MKNSINCQDPVHRGPIVTLYDLVVIRHACESMCRAKGSIIETNKPGSFNFFVLLGVWISLQIKMQQAVRVHHRKHLFISGLAAR